MERIHFKKDEKRDDYLRKTDLKVVRFDNLQVLKHTEAVVGVIFKEVSKTKSPRIQRSP